MAVFDDEKPSYWVSPSKDKNGVVYDVLLDEDKKKFDAAIGRSHRHDSRRQ